MTTPTPSVKVDTLLCVSGTYDEQTQYTQYVLEGSFVTAKVWSKDGLDFAIGKRYTISLDSFKEAAK